MIKNMQSSSKNAQNSVGLEDFLMTFVSWWRFFTHQSKILASGFSQKMKVERHFISRGQQQKSGWWQYLTSLPEAKTFFSGEDSLLISSKKSSRK